MVDSSSDYPCNCATKLVQFVFPVHMVETINKLIRIQRQLLQDLGREPTPKKSVFGDGFTN